MSSIEQLVGQTLGGCELRELLGVGGMGAVYRAYQKSLSREVAVKVMSPDLVKDATFLERFEREAKTSAALEHAHIVAVYEYGVEGKISYVVMRLLRGGTLTQRLSQQVGTQYPLPALGETAGLLNQLSGALDYAHSQGVIHRDIKPSNVMFDQHGNAYLVDFGIAKLVAATKSLTTTGLVMGTPLFMAPEQWRAEEVVPATDQYSLAVMAYLLVTGMFPFDADTPHGLMYKHLSENFPPPQMHRSDVPQEVTSVLERAMAKSSAERFQTTTAFAQAFERAVRGYEGQETHFLTAPIRVTKAASPVGGADTSVSGPHKAAAAPHRSWYRQPLLWGAAGIAVVVVVIVALLLSGGAKNNQGVSSDDRTGTAAAQQLAELGITVIPADLLGTGTLTLKPTRTLAPPAVTPTPINTQEIIPTATVPRATATLVIPPETQVWLDLSATAGQWRPTYTPTPTDTSTPTATPNTTATYQAQMAVAMQTLTAESWTDTPTVTNTASSTPTETPTTTPTPTFTPTLTPSATSTPTLTPTNTLTPTPTPTNTSTPPPPQVITTANAGQLVELFDLEDPDDFFAEGAKFSPAGTLLAINSGDVVKLWDIASRQIVRRIQADGVVEGFAFSADGTMLAITESGGVQIVDVASGRVLNMLKVNAHLTGIAFSPDGTRLAFAAGDNAQIIDIATGRSLTMLGSADRMDNVIWSPDGTRLATAGWGNGISWWDIATGEKLQEMHPDSDMVISIALSPDGTLLASSNNGYPVDVRDLATGQTIKEFGVGEDHITTLAFSPDGTLLATGGEDNRVRVWDVATSQVLCVLNQLGDIGSVDFSPDGRLLASVTSREPLVRLWGIPVRPKNLTDAPILAYAASR
jgi:WD40 repeat protein